MRKIGILLIVCCLWLLFSASTCFAQMYTLTDLGTLGGSWSEASGINASGQVVGISEIPDNTWGPLWQAFRTHPNSGINAPTDDLKSTTVPCQTPDEPGGCVAGAFGINDSGQAVGWTKYIDGDHHPFRTAANATITSPDDVMMWAEEGEANGVNNSGQTVGWELAFGGIKAFREDASIATRNDIGSGIAYGINDSGQVVGQSSGHAFRTAPNTAINPATDDIGTLGGSSSSASSINAFGQVVGSASTSGDTASHAFRTFPNATINPVTDDLGTLGGSSSSATGINDFGQVVGWSTLAGDAAQHAFLYDGGVIRDLNDLISSGSSCALVGVQHSPSYASSPNINDAGQIAANVICNGLPHAVRLDPIYKALVRPPIKPDGTSVFFVKRGVVPVKFRLTQYDAPTCTLPPATIAITRATSETLASVSEGNSHFRINGCRYHYNLSTSSLGIGTYRVDISINGIMIGHAVFTIKQCRRTKDSDR